MRVLCVACGVHWHCGGALGGGGAQHGVVRAHSLQPCLTIAPVMCARRSFLGETGEPEASLAFAFYKEGASDPTFLFFKYALVEEKC